MSGLGVDVPRAEALSSTLATLFSRCAAIQEYERHDFDPLQGYVAVGPMIYRLEELPESPRPETTLIELVGDRVTELTFTDY